MKQSVQEIQLRILFGEWVACIFPNSIIATARTEKTARKRAAKRLRELAEEVENG